MKEGCPSLSHPCLLLPLLLHILLLPLLATNPMAQFMQCIMANLTSDRDPLPLPLVALLTPELVLLQKETLHQLNRTTPTSLVLPFIHPLDGAAVVAAVALSLTPACQILYSNHPPSKVFSETSRDRSHRATKTIKCLKGKPDLFQN